jgi:MFS superfamily sulfate permease-like transporter
VAVAQVPEAVAFAFLAGLDPLLGLHASWMMGMFIQVCSRLVITSTFIIIICVYA